MYWNINLLKAKDLELNTQNGKYQFKNIQQGFDKTLSSEQLILILPNKKKIIYINVEVYMDEFNQINIVRAEKYQIKDRDFTIYIEGLSFDVKTKIQKEGKSQFTNKKMEQTYFGSVFDNGILKSTHLIINKSLDKKESLLSSIPSNVGNQIMSTLNFKSQSQSTIMVLEQLEDVIFAENGSMSSIKKRTQIFQDGTVLVTDNLIFDINGKELQK